MKVKMVPDGEDITLDRLLGILEGEKQVLKPRGKPLRPVKEVVITDDDIDAAIAEWDEDVQEAAGLLRALVK